MLVPSHTFRSIDLKSIKKTSSHLLTSGLFVYIDSDSDDEKRSRPEKHKLARLQRQTTTTPTCLASTTPAPTTPGDDVVDGSVLSPTTSVVNASKLKNGEKRTMVSFLAPNKPTTPKNKKKEVRRDNKYYRFSLRSDFHSLISRKLSRE